MKLLALTFVALVASAYAEAEAGNKDTKSHQEKRGAVDVAYSQASVKQAQQQVYATASPIKQLPQSVAYKTLSYQPQYVSGPAAQVKYAAAPQVYQQAYQQVQPQYNYEQYEPQQYVAAAPQVKTVYAQQPAAIKYAAAPQVQKLAYQAAPVAQAVHYSPANTVSSFQYSSPVVTYSNLGLISQKLGNLAVAQAAQPVAYAAAPQQQQYTYAQAPQQQVAYATAPQVQYASVPQQYSQPQFAYSSAPSAQYQGAQYQGAQYQGAHSISQPIYTQAPISYTPKYYHSQ